MKLQQVHLGVPGVGVSILTDPEGPVKQTGQNLVYLRVYVSILTDPEGPVKRDIHVAADGTVKFQSSPIRKDR